MKNIPLNALRTFEAVASRLSFSKGAEALNVTPAAVSSQIRTLEERLDQKLFHRKGRNITLTAAGRQLLPGVQRGLREMNQAIRLLEQDRSRGVLNVSVMPSFMQRWLAHRLAEFYNANPEIDLRINSSNAVVDFNTTDFHVAIRFGPGHWSGLRAVKMMDDWIVPVCSPELLKESGPMEKVEDLRNHNLLVVDDQMWNEWVGSLGGTEIERNWPALDDSLSLMIMAEQGHGVALVRWSLVVRDLEAGRLVRAIPIAVKTNWSYYFVSPSHYFELPKVKVFRDWLFEHAAKFEHPE
jgi:LysR family glycine cleavage system transcriptional activator